MPDVTATLQVLQMHVRSALAALERARSYSDCVAGLDAINDAKVSTMEVNSSLHRLEMIEAGRHRRTDKV
jgi:hypothetical protein